MYRVITGLTVLVALVVALAGPGAAAPIPGVFDQTNPSALCAQADSTLILVQVNFDPNENDGIPGIDLATADALFAELQSIPILNMLLSPNLAITCQLTPSQSQALIPGVTATQFVEVLSPIFQSQGFAAYIVLDVYNWQEPEFLGFADTMRADIYIVNGANDLTYVGTLTVPRALIP
jgi:hypothetical protein